MVFGKVVRLIIFILLMQEENKCCPVMHKNIAPCKLVAGIVLFLLTYYLSPETGRTMWLILTALLAVCGLVHIIKKKK